MADHSLVNQTLREFGLEPTITGTALLGKMMLGEITTANLNDFQIKQVLEAWDTRTYVPAKKQIMLIA